MKITKYKIDRHCCACYTAATTRVLTVQLSLANKARVFRHILRGRGREQDG